MKEHFLCALGLFLPIVSNINGVLLKKKNQDHVGRRKSLGNISAAMFAIGLTLGNFSLTAPVTPSEKESQPDVAFEGPIKNQRVQMLVRMPYLELGGIHLKTTGQATIAMFVMRFTSKKHEQVRFHLELFSDKKKLLGTAIHDEKLGPDKDESLRRKSPMPDIKWNRERGILVSVPDIAINASTFKLDITGISR